jgi:type II secretory pathway pseudopilin PulG
LLIVIAILALLVAILLPSLSQAMSMARLVACQSNLSGQVKAHHLYAGVYDDHKPPIGLGQARDDGVTPNVKQAFAPSGQGILVSDGFIEFDQLLCPAGSMKDDAQRDRRKWQSNAPYSGCSYVYFYRYERTPSASGVTYAYASARGQLALVIDINCEQGSGYQGPYADRAWASHPAVEKVNVGFLDGSVLTFTNDHLVLQAPGAGNELYWWDEANRHR